MSNQRISFDWSTLNRNSLIDIFTQSFSEIIDKELTADRIRNIFNRNIKKYIPIRIVRKSDKAVEKGWIYIGGVYDGERDRKRKPCIEVNFTFNSEQQSILVNRFKCRIMSRLFADVVLHEIIHMRQYRRRKFKPLPDYESNAEMDELRQEQSYLGCTDEIDAYSFNIACELLEKFKGDKKLAIKYLGQNHRKGKLKSNSLKSYLKAFEYDHNHIIIKRLKKRVVRYIPRAEEGRPYRTKDWINR